jgi:phasin protein
MSITPNYESSSHQPAASLPFFDFVRVSEMNGGMLTETAKINAKLSATMQNIGKEWTEFVGARLHEDQQLLDTLRHCKTLPEIQHAYAEFWQNAFSQYGEEARRMMKISQGVVEETARAVQEHADASVETHRAA